MLILVSLIILFALINLANVSAETYPCCCAGSNAFGDEVCGMGSGSDITPNECYGACRGISYSPHPNSWCGSEGYCVSLGEYEWDEPEDVVEEICNGLDDDEDGMIDEDEATCESSECLADEGECPLGSVCTSNTISLLGQIIKTITGRAEENNQQCKICASKCKTCPPHPPRATKNNPLGICASEKDGGYPFSKECIDYLNMVSCVTCVDNDANVPGRETLAARKNDGTAGVNQDGYPIWGGTSFEKGTGKVISDQSSSALFPRYTREGGNNKDVLSGDNPVYHNYGSGEVVNVGEIIDCALFAQIHYQPKKPLQDEENAWFGVCNGMMCVNQECTADCYNGYEKWVDKNGKKVEPKGPYVEKLMMMCPKGSYYYKKGYGYTNVKYKGSWGNLFNDAKGSVIPPNCYVDDMGDSDKCDYLVNRDYPNGRKLDQRISADIIRDACIAQYNKNAYFYIYLGATFNSYCKCWKSTLELMQSASADIPNYERYYSVTASLKNPINSYVQDSSEDNLFRLLNAVREWVLS